MHPLRLPAGLQATRLTELDLECPHTADEEHFYFWLATATQLRSLAIAGSNRCCSGRLLFDEEELGAERHAHVVHELLGGALAALTGLTELSLTELHLRDCPAGSSGGMPSLTNLQRLSLTDNRDDLLLPNGLYQRGLTSLAVDSDVLAVALADVPGHALWGMAQLASLTVNLPGCCAELCTYDYGETVAQWKARQGALRAQGLLPCLRETEFVGDLWGLGEPAPT